MDLSSNLLPDLSNDELMLEELGRRDGIYSFIFHELDSKTPTDKHECILSEDIDLIKMDLQSIKVEDIGKTYADNLLYRSKDKLKRSDVDSKWLETMPAAPPHLVMPTKKKINHSYNSLGSSSSSKYFRTSISPYFGCDNNKLPYYESAAVPLIYDCSSAQYANKLFQIRAPAPSFSHYTEPLIRNRRHILKETSEYKNSFKKHWEIPDLRRLFPLDPDVHAPFMEAATLLNVGPIIVDEIAECSAKPVKNDKVRLSKKMRT